jgi:glycosyltransferase involved in cell wall biosynthesis
MGTTANATIEVKVLGPAEAARQTIASIQRSQSACRLIPLVSHLTSLPPGDRSTITGDVVVLQAGVELFGNWLDRLAEAAQIGDDTATVSPFSNQGPLCGYPAPKGINQQEDQAINWERVDSWAARVNPGCYLRIPLPGQACVYFRHDYLRQTHHQSPAERQPWRHLLATNVCVHQQQNPSPEQGEFLGCSPTHVDRAAMDIFWHADPALVFRRRLDVERLQGPGAGWLFITHHGGGGTERHVLDLARRLQTEGIRAYVLRPWASGQLRLERFGMAGTPNLLFETETEYYYLLQVLRGLGIVHVHVHHALGHLTTLARLLADLDVPYDWTIHDYHLICPRIQLYDQDGRYCGEPAPAGCNDCLARNGDYHGVRNGTEIGLWRARSAHWLSRARRVFVPHADVASRLGRYFPQVNFTVREHFEDLTGIRPVAAPRKPGEPLRVVLLGTLAVHKGANLLLALAQDAVQRRLAIEFRVVGGPTYREEELVAAGVIAVGPYEDRQVFEVLEAQACHCALFLSQWPETYCYTLSIAQAGGLYSIGLDLGALGARIRESGWGEVVPWDSDPQTINDRLLAIGDWLPNAGPAPQPHFTSYHNLLGDYYELGESFDRVRLPQAA